MSIRFARLASALIMVLVALSFTACGPIRLPGTDYPQLYSMNGVKLISPDYTRGDDPATLSQPSYSLSPTRRLLLRFEDLESHVSSVQIGNGKKVEVEITVSDPASPDDAKTHLKLCPVLKNWMMLATWDVAHPFGSDGHWLSSGGDYAQTNCVRATRIEKQSLYFDVTDWFVDFARGRGQNYGLILTADSNISIEGDSSPSYSPRILWVE